MLLSSDSQWEENKLGDPAEFLAFFLMTISAKAKQRKYASHKNLGDYSQRLASQKHLEFVGCNT